MKQLVIWMVVLFLAAGAVAWFLLANLAAVTAPEQAAPADTTESSLQPVPSEPSATSTTAATSTPAGGANEDGEYVGLSVAEAESLAAANNVPFRVVERDGEMLPTTRDYRPGRINATVESGTVVSYNVEGEGNNKKEEEGKEPVDDDESMVPNDNTEEGQHDEILGMTVAEAEAYAEAKEVPFRVGTVDGEPRGLTMDYRPGRITADVKDGVVTDYSVE